MHQLPPAQPGMRETDVETPALILDLDAFEFNLDTMARTVAGTRVKLRPHAKTHKCPVVAQLQMRRGAIGQCVQKIAEAEAMAWGGVNDILVTNEIVDPRKLARLAALSSIAQVAVSVDSLKHITLIEAAAQAAGIRMSALIEIDVGAGRCGVAPGAEAVELARHIANSRHLAFAGLQAYHGTAQHLRSAADRRQAIGKAILACEQTVEALSRSRIPCGIVSGGGTGTFELEAASGVYTELQVGSYCFMDGDYAANLEEDGQPFGLFQHSLFVLASVMSTTKPGLAVLDAGHKAVAIERGLPTVWQQPELRIVSAADEHARMEYPPALAAPELGERFRLVPRHCDPTVDRFDWYVCVRAGRVESVWPITARGGMQ
ncbi:DSD1 family PLP-dependent enzyme [Polaromonas sp. YR568]|uniref:DSD1 family PLP-dependent enzyme n=1 Tax=Polaromonas sp. YR568 TaxID=1855301 RepID=UPI00313812D8